MFRKFTLFFGTTLAIAPPFSLQTFSQHEFPTTSTESDIELMKLIIICRHGHRTPRLRMSSILPHSHSDNDSVEWDCPPLIQHTLSLNNQIPHSTINFESFHEKTGLIGNCLRGQLTSQGSIQMYNLGSLYSLAYRHFLTSLPLQNYSIRSTNVETRRTEESAKYFAQGFFSHSWIKKPSQIKIAMREPSLENLYPNFKCSKLFNHMLKSVENPIVQQKAIQMGCWNILKRINIKEQMHPFFVLSTLNSIRAHDDINLPLPAGVTKDDLKRLENYSSWYAKHLFGDNMILRLSCGTFLHELVHSLDNSDRSKECQLYFAHDTLLLPLRLVFENVSHPFPSFASSMCLELYNDSSNRRYLRILFDGEPIEIDHLKPVDGKYLYNYQDVRDGLQQFIISESELIKLCQESSMDSL